MILDPDEYIEANLKALASERVVMFSTNDHSECPYFCRLMSILSPAGAPSVGDPAMLAASLVDQKVIQRYSESEAEDVPINSDDQIIAFSETLYRKVHGIKVLDTSASIRLLHEYLDFLDAAGIRTGADNWPMLDMNVTNDSNITGFIRSKTDSEFHAEYIRLCDDWNEMYELYRKYYALVARYNNPDIAQHDIIQPFRDISDTILTLVRKSKDRR